MFCIIFLWFCVRTTNLSRKISLGFLIGPALSTLLLIQMQLSNISANPNTVKYQQSYIQKLQLHRKFLRLNEN